MKKQVLIDKILQNAMVATIGLIAVSSNAQMVVNGSNAKIVCVGAPQIMLNNISYKNEASSTHFVPASGNVQFVGSSATTSNISSTAGYTTEFGQMTVSRNAGVVLQAPLSVNNTLFLTNGLLDLTTFNLTMGVGAITGGSPTSYVKTSSTGVLSRTVSGTALNFPVGLSAYNPAMITNTGTIDNFSVRLLDNVTANGTGVGATTTEAVVKRTWMIEEATAGGSNATLRLYWNGSGEEINSFVPASAFMAHYVSAASMWDNIGGTIGVGYVETSGNISFSPYTISSSTAFAPLPVELLSLEAACDNEDVIVSWKTASEHNTLNFTVERSDNGLNWNEVQTVAAVVNSNAVEEYAIQDKGAARSLNYYRLIQSDQDGIQKIYGPIMSNCGSDKISFMTFPNPSDAEFTLVINGIEITGETTMNVRDANGKLVRSLALYIQPGVNSFLVPDLELAPGMYYLQLENENYLSPSLKQSIR